MNKAQILKLINVYISLAEHDIKSRYEIIEIIKQEINRQSSEAQIYLLTNAIQPKLNEIESLGNMISKLKDYELNLPNLAETEMETKFTDIIRDYKRI